jgi:hypothetical protein
MRDLEPIVSIGSSQRGWASALTRFISDYGGARLRGTVITALDAVDQEYDVLIIDDIASYLSPRFVDRVQRLHRLVIGVFDPDAGDGGRIRLEEMGVDAIVESDAGPDEILKVVESLRGIEGFADVTMGTGAPMREREAPSRGHVTAVFGGDLATEVALALADQLAGAGEAVVACDLDTVRPSFAQRLGMALVPNLLSALDAHTQLRGTVEDSLVATLRGYLLLLGLPEPQEWNTIQPVDVVDLIDRIADASERTIVKLDPNLEDLAGLSTRQGRFDVSRVMAERATDIVVLSESTPLGLARTLGWVARARNVSTAPIHVAFERSPSGLYQRGELSEELVRSFVPASIVWLPDDGRVAKAAWNGEVVGPGGFTKAVGGLVRKLTPVRAGAAA